MSPCADGGGEDVTREIEGTVKGASASIFSGFLYGKAKNAHLWAWTSFILKAAPVWNEPVSWGCQYFSLSAHTEHSWGCHCPAWGGFSSFSSPEQKALRAPRADAALGLELLLWKTALGERSHL